MAKSIKTIHDRINHFLKKGLTSYFAPERLDDEINAESLNLWNKYLEEFLKSDMKKLNMRLRPFESEEEVVITAGAGTIVTKDLIYACKDLDGNEVHLVDDAKERYRINHPIKTPNTTYPVAVIHNQDIKVYPNTITKVFLSYLAPPVKAVYAYSVVSGKYVYDDVNSVDIQWHPSVHDYIINRVLVNLGVPLDKLPITQFGNLERSTEDR